MRNGVIFGGRNPRCFPRTKGRPTGRSVLSQGSCFFRVGLFLLEGVQGSIVGLVVAAVGLLALVTGATGRCVLYIPFGITTLRATQARRHAHRKRRCRWCPGLA